jgi:hypothetical protein
MRHLENHACVLEMAGWVFLLSGGGETARSLSDARRFAPDADDGERAGGAMSRFWRQDSRAGRPNLHTLKLEIFFADGRWLFWSFWARLKGAKDTRRSLEVVERKHVTLFFLLIACSCRLALPPASCLASPELRFGLPVPSSSSASVPDQADLPTSPTTISVS